MGEIKITYTRINPKKFRMHTNLQVLNPSKLRWELRHLDCVSDFEGSTNNKQDNYQYTITVVEGTSLKDAAQAVTDKVREYEKPEVNFGNLQ